MAKNPDKSLIQIRVRIENPSTVLCFFFRRFLVTFPRLFALTVTAVWMVVAGYYGGR